MSRFANFRQGIREKVSSVLGHPSSEGDTGDDGDLASRQAAEELAKEEAEARKHEYRLRIALDKVRQLYYERKLQGSIDISATFLCVTNTISCDVDPSASAHNDGIDNDGGDIAQDNNGDGDDDEEKTPRITKLALRGAMNLLKRLESRVRAYAHKAYKDDLTISGSIDISDPMGLTGMSVSCSVSVSSLLEYVNKK